MIERVNMKKTNINEIKKSLDIPQLKRLTQTERCKLKKILKNSEDIGIMDHYFTYEGEIWTDIEFEDAGWLWDTGYAKHYGIKNVLKTQALERLRNLKNGYFYIDKDRLELIPKYSGYETHTVTIHFSDEF